MIGMVKSFGEANFGDADLGDKRRTARLVRTADLMCRRPGGTLPQKLRNPRDLRGFYRLMDSDRVTHEAILAPHRAAVMQTILDIKSTVLVLHDATELDFTTHQSLKHLGQIGNGNNRGYIAHNSLAVNPQNRAVIGLCNQVLHQRAKVGKGESISEKRKRESRESLLWLKGTQPLPGDWNLVDVCDQGADTFEFLEHETNSGRRFVIRAAYDRGILTAHDSTAMPSHLRRYARKLPAAGSWTLAVTSNVRVKSPKKKGRKQVVQRKARQASLHVASAPVQIKSPNSKNGQHGNQPIRVWVIRVWEPCPPRGQERLEWFLVTNEPIQTFEDAYRVVGWYECRWIVEEYHKGMKTGCRIESPQFTDEDRLQPAIALLSILTLTLLAMRDASRCSDAKIRPATNLISEDYVMVLSAWRHRRHHPDWSIHDFYLALARLGGHQNRNHDHPPGWQVIWEGWKELQAMVCGADAVKQLERCG